MDRKHRLDQVMGSRRDSILAEFGHFLKENKKWWLVPILLVIALLALISLFASTGAAPFIYTLF